MRISDWSSDVCSSDLNLLVRLREVEWSEDGLIDIPFGIDETFQQIAFRVGEIDRPTDAVIAAEHLFVSIAGSFKPAVHVAQVRDRRHEIGRASCRDRVCQYVWI